jgi:hypothetical protein
MTEAEIKSVVVDAEVHADLGRYEVTGAAWLPPM